MPKYLMLFSCLTILLLISICIFVDHLILMLTNFVGIAFKVCIIKWVWFLIRRVSGVSVQVCITLWDVVLSFFSVRYRVRILFLELRRIHNLVTVCIGNQTYTCTSSIWK